MAFQIGARWDDGLGRIYMELSNPMQATQLYEQQKAFWVTRNQGDDGTISAEMEAEIIADQLSEYSGPGFETTKPILYRAVRLTQERGQTELSIVEIGAANGGTVRHFEKFHPEYALGFYGMEALPLLAEDGAKKYPQHRFQAGTAEDFVELTAEDLGRERFDMFLASGVLCMLLPELAFMVLRKASEISDMIVCRDYLANKGGEISRKRPVMFELVPGHTHYLFANPYELLLRSLGFSRIEYIFEESADPRIRGTASFLALRSR